MDPKERLNQFLLLMSGDAQKDDKVLTIQEDAKIYSATIEPRKQINLDIQAGYGAYFYCISGKVRLNDKELESRDAAKVLKEPFLTVDGVEKAELFVVVVRV